MDDGFLTLSVPGWLMEKVGLEQILQTNAQAQEHGLILTPADAAEILIVRRDALKNLDRIEIGGTTIVKLIEAFCDSAFINQADYTDTINQLLEIFYIYKNETLDLVPDDELIEMMKTFYEGICQGSLELLAGRELEAVARNIRAGRKYNDDGEPAVADDGDEEDAD